MVVVLAAGIGLMGALLGSVLTVLIPWHTARKDKLRTTAARFAHRLAVHRGNLYARWELARQENPSPAEMWSANCVSDSSRSDVTLALYELRVLTRDTALLRLAEEAIAATYAVKPRGEDLATVSRAEMDARHDRGVAADHAFLAAAAGI
ncbi:hypothetical protein [Streptomyces sp. NPDC048392]|uniref:hypothetical protein n=1 Tax=Streptomyces sp. NPDC048392 TaxID=3365543 RepID=UPI00371112EB